MKEEDRKYYRLLASASAIGFELVFSIFIGVGIGLWLDSKFGTLPWLTLIFLLLGLAAAGLNYYRFAAKIRRDEEGPKRQ